MNLREVTVYLTDFSGLFTFRMHFSYFAVLISYHFLIGKLWDESQMRFQTLKLSQEL